MEFDRMKFELALAEIELRDSQKELARLEGRILTQRDIVSDLLQRRDQLKAKLSSAERSSTR